MPNAWDGGSARLLAGLGFEAIATTSAGLAWSLGRADGSVSRQEAMSNARAIADATSLPVSADLENGYGPDADDVRETIVLAGAAGLAGASIEDASGELARPIYELDRAVERVQAAVEANRGLAVPLLLTARAENFLHGCFDLEDTIKRLVAYQNAGADVLFAPGLPDVDGVREVCAALDRPVNVLAGGGAPVWTAERLFAAGAQRISVGSALARAALNGFIDAASMIRDGGRFDFVACRPDYAGLNRMMNSPGPTRTTPEAVPDELSAWSEEKRDE